MVVVFFTTNDIEISLRTITNNIKKTEPRWKSSKKNRQDPHNIKVYLKS